MDPSHLQEDFCFQAMKVMTAHLYPASNGSSCLPGSDGIRALSPHHCVGFVRAMALHRL